MDRIFKLLILLLILPCTIWAEDEKKKELPDKPTYMVLIQSSEGRKDRPRAPAMAADIECYYYDGYIHIEFSEAEGDATLRLVDEMTTETASYSFSTLSPFTVYIGVPTDVLRIEVVTSYGNTYVGYLTEW